MSELFRKKSMDKLSSPDQLDLLMRITNPRGWIALVALGFLVGVAVLWGIFGTLPTRVSSQGLFLRSGGLLEIISPSSGQIKDIYFETGDIVEQGYPIARIMQPELLAGIKHLRASLKDLNLKYEHISSSEQEEISMEETSSANRKLALEKKIDDLDKQAVWLRQRIANQKLLFEDGLVVKQTLLDNQSRLDAIFQQIRENKNTLEQLDIQLHHRGNQKDLQLEELERQIAAKQRELMRMIEDMGTASKVLSPYFGRILELSVRRGDVVGKGASLATLESVGKNSKGLEAVLYVSALQGKKIKPGMKVQLSPSTVKQEEYGFILGLVTSVSEFPVSRLSMMSTLRNNALVSTLTQTGAPIEVKADLIPDPRTPSGYKWSSGKGPDISLESGTFCTSRVVVEECRPITLVIPFFKKHLMGL